MKARILWLVEGDRDTSFFHTSALVCRRCNRILCMKDSMGNWLDGDKEIADFIRKGFSTLLTTGIICAPLADWIPPFWQTFLKEKEARHLDRPVSNEEITAGLWALKPFKASAADGLHAGFFQCFWLLMGDPVKKEVKSIFSNGIMPEYMNKTLITLIPKCKSPESLSHYCPISLCNTIYKIFTKIIVNRICPLLLKLVSPLQSAFIPPRQGVDNAIIVQELVHTISKKRGVGGAMAIKLDLEKAYDRLEWNFNGIL